MNPLEYREYYRRKLPHIQPAGATLFVTFRLTNSIPKARIQEFQDEKALIEKRLGQIRNPKEQKREANKIQSFLFGKWDALLDRAQNGPYWLRENPIAELVAQALYHRDTNEYDLIAFCIMPNHVHVVLKPLEREDATNYALSAILHSLKRYTASEANKCLNRQGSFWQHENYDHYVRNAQELARITHYVILNPVKAGLVREWQHWKWSFSKYVE